jgi:hypothetical protein
MAVMAGASANYGWLAGSYEDTIAVSLPNAGMATPGQRAMMTLTVAANGRVIAA